MARGEEGARVGGARAHVCMCACVCGGLPQGVKDPIVQHEANGLLCPVQRDPGDAWVPFQAHVAPVAFLDRSELERERRREGAEGERRMEGWQGGPERRGE